MHFTEILINIKTKIMVIGITAILSNQLNKTKPTLWLSLEKEPSMTAR